MVLVISRQLLVASVQMLFYNKPSGASVFSLTVLCHINLKGVYSLFELQQMAKKTREV